MKISAIQCSTAIVMNFLEKSPVDKGSNVRSISFKELTNNRKDTICTRVPFRE